MPTSELDTFRSTISEGSAVYGCPLSDAALDAIEKYYKLLREWNSKMNLISSGDLERFAEFHILDSLKIASVADFSSMKMIMDFGSGAGLPGIPLAAAFPNMEVELVDSRLKPCSFLSEVAKEIPELNIKVTRTRVEEIPRKYNIQYDAIISRATVTLSALYQISHRFLRKGGSIIAIKGENLDAEFTALETVVNKSLFHISSTVPEPYKSVRCGKLIRIVRK